MEEGLRAVGDPACHGLVHPVAPDRAARKTAE